MAAVSLAEGARLVGVVTSFSSTENPSDVESNSSSLSSSPLSSSPREYPTELNNSILEEDDETESEPPNEPVTPVSGRQSQDLHHWPQYDLGPIDINESFIGLKQDIPVLATPGCELKATALPLVILHALAPPLTTRSRANTNGDVEHFLSPARSTARSTASPAHSTSAGASADEADLEGTPTGRRRARRSTRGLRRKMSNLFRIGASNGGSDKPTGTNGASQQNDLGSRPPPRRRWTMNRSSNTTLSSTPPTPSSPVETTTNAPEATSSSTVPNPEQFLSRKLRATTGLHLPRVAFLNSHSAQSTHVPRRRAGSFGESNQDNSITIHSQESQNANPRHIWGLFPEEGTGVKARRMSLSLPDDFGVDVGELMAEYEYQSKLGRHGKHLGKGATSTVALIIKKGYPGELYAVKEFRKRMQCDTVDEYEKKIKSEYTLAKSLHHPNIIETVRLCTDHGRWNHVMEYCQEGDLFSLVKKGYLKTPEREKDRQCLFKQLLQGVNYLHNNGIAHRDIKLENLLMTSESRLKITDFGVSEVFSGVHPGLREAGGLCGQLMLGEIRLSSPGICGSMPYISPEVLDKKAPYDPRGLDVWSSAIVMLNLVFGAPLWEEAQVGGRHPSPNYLALVNGWTECNAKEHDADVAEKDFPRVDAFDQWIKPPALKRVLLQMLNPDPSKRLSISAVLNNRWVKKIECCHMESYEEPVEKFDASKKEHLNNLTQRKVFCHNHLPATHQFSSHSLGKMPGQAGY